MSLVQFDEVYEICCEMADMKVVEVGVQRAPKAPEMREDARWWEEVVQEVMEQEKQEKEEREAVVV